jgi:hypothetical protein
VSRLCDGLEEAREVCDTAARGVCEKTSACARRGTSRQPELRGSSVCCGNEGLSVARAVWVERVWCGNEGPSVARAVRGEHARCGSEGLSVSRVARVAIAAMRASRWPELRGTSARVAATKATLAWPESCGGTHVGPGRAWSVDDAFEFHCRQLKTRMRSCHGCGVPARLRRCSRQVLCAACRQRPEYLLIRKAEAVRTGLREWELPAPLGKASNRKDPRLAPELVWFWADIALACAQLGYPIP